MGQQGSKKKGGKSGSGKGLFGDLADAAEGATSSLTKVIEDTSHQVTSTIETTTKSVTEAIDKTAKNVTGTVDQAAADANKTAQDAAGAADDAAANLKAQAEAARKDAEGKAKGFKDAADSKARELEEAAKALEDAAVAKAKEAEKAAGDKKKDLENAARELEAAAESKVKEVQNAAAAKKKEMEDAAAATQKELEKQANEMKSAAEAKGKELRQAAEAAAKEAEAAAAAKKAEVEAKAAELEKAAAARKKQLEEAAAAKMKEAQKAAEDVAAAAEAKAKEAEAEAAKRAQELEDAVAEASQAAQAKSNELQTAASDKAKEMQSSANKLRDDAQGQADAARSSFQGKVSGAQSQATGLRGTLDSTVSDIRGTAEQTAADLKSQTQNAFDEAKNSAQRVQDDIGKTISDANQALIDAQNKAKADADAAKTGLTDLAGNTVGLLKGTAGTLTDTLKSTATGVVDQAVNVASETAKKTVHGVSTTVSKATEDVTKGLTHAVQDVSNSVTGAAGAAAAGLLGKAGAFSGALAQGAADISKTAEGFSNITKGTTDQSRRKAENLDDMADSLLKDATDAGDGLLNDAKSTSDSLAQDAKNAGKKSADTMDDIAGGLMKGAASLPKKIKNEIKDVVKEFDKANATTVCKEDELKDGEMKVFPVGEGSILLCRDKGKYSAIGTKCSHYGAPLAKGVLYNGKVRCPWHGACFNATTGDIEDSPGLDSIPSYPVLVEGGEVKVSVLANEAKHNMRTKDLCKRSSKDPRIFVIIGGGGAGEACAETLRQEGFTGRVVLLTKENNNPYDRPKLSKALSSTAKDLALRSEDYYKNGDIEIMLGHEVSSVSVKNKTVQCENGAKFKYNSLMIATGGSPITLDVPGKDLDNICYIRTPEDANKVAQFKDKNIVVIGTSFIGMEVAAYLHGKAKSVTIVGRSSTPFAQIFGPQVGERLTNLYKEKDINFQFKTEVEEFLGEDGKLTAVKLKNGEVLDADVCVVGIGVRPATDFLKSSGMYMNDNGTIPVDETLKTTSESIFAGGDIVEFPLSTYDDEFLTIGHWQIAQTHGRVAARTMLGSKKTLHTVPFFWASMFGKSLRYAGCGLNVDDYVIDGDLQELKFVCYVCSGDKVVAVTAMGMDPVASQFASYVAKGNVLKKSEIKSNPQGWISKMC